MPATEQTWRDSKLLHLVFGLSSLAMLIATIWMLAADHRREWKTYQQTFQGVETWTARARLSEQESAQYLKELGEAEAELKAAKSEVPKGTLVDAFNQAVRDQAAEEGETANVAPIDDAYKAIKQAEPDARPELRNKFRDALNTYVARARFHENEYASLKKSHAAFLDVYRSEYELGVGNELPKDKLEAMQIKVDEERAKVEETTGKLQNMSTYRKQLESLVVDIFATETDAKKKYDDLLGKKVQLDKAIYERERHAMTDVIGLPIIDAFAPKKVDQIWLPRLTINNNFRDVPRFDRCINCHQGIDRTAPGSAIDPGYPQEHTKVLTLATPAEMPAQLKNKPADPAELDKLYETLASELYGLKISPQGLLNPNDAVVSVVTPELPGAKAQLKVGDAITLVDDAPVTSPKSIYNPLFETVTWGKPLKLTVRRGLPQPYASHPRLDLFVGSLSPHKLADVGCTICHDGQGSATAFMYASHSPNDPLQSDEWKQKYGWFDNHHWIFPMYPKRFSESLCLKCHHDVTELTPSKQFPEAPAPKLVEGFNLIKDYGCYGCHEVNGYDGPNRRIGPDLRTEPNYAAASEALLAIDGLSDAEKEWAEQVVRNPDDTAARHSLSAALRNAEKLPGDPNVTRRLVNVLDDVETPGKLRKVGPSLRHVASKVDFDFLYSWIRKPTDFRPETKMPQFFGLFSALDHDSLHLSEKFEPVEIRGATEYLLSGSQPFKYAEAPKDVTEAASAERGKFAFEVRCLACHEHSAFPAGKMTQGPNLSRLGSKLDRPGNPNGTKWLYSWLRDPSRYHARTLMPNMILEPTKDKDGKVSDPAADIAAFLLADKGWEPTNVPGRDLTKEESQSLEDLALEHLKNVFPLRLAKQFLQTGIPEARRDELKGDEIELLGDMTTDKKLRYVGRRTISKYGCSGCHDIPGFEDVKPIGTGLADWARKTPDKLAFEQIVEYMKHGHGKPQSLDFKKVDGPQAHVTTKEADVEIEEAETSSTHHAFNFLDMDADTGYFMEKLVGHQREGFIWQKLREPRSYDYEKTKNKSYNERLRMPQFTAFNDAQREAIITFVLGLVAEPPAAQYVYKSDVRRAAIVQGKEIIEKFNCTGCHTLEQEQWKLAYAPDDFADPAEIGDYSFLKAHFSPQEVAASLATDARGLRHASISGTAAVDEQGLPTRIDEDGAPIADDDTETKAFYLFTPWENVLLNGQAWQSGLQNLRVPASTIEKRYPPEGGFLARLAYPTVVAANKAEVPNAASEAWGWLPPPLVGEGRKVQTEWLHNFLLDPHTIRPAAVLRMPKFNMSPNEATKLVNYFAAVDGVDYPYDFDPRTRASHLAKAEAEHPQRLTDALKIVTDNSFCIKCHLLGDFEPKGSERAKAPQLAEVFKRLRPNYTLDWIANPKRILPYTAMPVNVPFDKPVSEALFKGTSDQQLNAVVDLLLNFDRFTESKMSIKPLIKEAPPADGAQPKNEQAAGATNRGDRDGG